MIVFIKKCEKAALRATATVGRIESNGNGPGQWVFKHKISYMDEEETEELRKKRRAADVNEHRQDEMM